MVLQVNMSKKAEPKDDIVSPGSCSLPLNDKVHFAEGLLYFCTHAADLVKW